MSHQPGHSFPAHGLPLGSQLGPHSGSPACSLANAHGWLESEYRASRRPVARMIKRHLEGILTAVVLGITNARAEGINAKIQWLKYTARGFRNRERFRQAI